MSVEPFTIRTTPDIEGVAVSLMVTEDAHYDLWIRAGFDPEDAAAALRVIADHIEQKLAQESGDPS